MEDRLLWNIRIRYFTTAEALISNGHQIDFVHVKAALCLDGESSWFFRYILGRYHQKMTPDNVHELLRECIKNYMYEALCLILESFEDDMTDVMDKKYKNHTLLQKAVQGNRSLIASRLIKAGADVHVLDDANNNLLHLCVIHSRRCCCDRTSMAKVLIDAGVDKSAQNVTGNTPVDVALATGHNSLAIYINNVEPAIKS